MSGNDEILSMDRLRCDAMIRADLPTLSALFADDMVWIHGTARVDGKAGMLQTIGTGKTRYLEISCSEQQVRRFGALAMVGGIADTKLESAGEVRSLKNRYTICWLNDGASWKVVNWQSTPLRA